MLTGSGQSTPETGNRQAEPLVSGLHVVIFPRPAQRVGLITVQMS
jgi:hypothetical protein